MSLSSSPASAAEDMEDQAPHASDSETRAEPSQNGPCPPVQSASAAVATEAQSHAYSPVRRSGQSHRQGFLPPSPRGVPLPGQYRHLVPGRREREDVVMKSEQEEPSLGSARSVVPRILGLADQPRQEQDLALQREQAARESNAQATSLARRLECYQPRGEVWAQLQTEVRSENGSLI